MPFVSRAIWLIALPILVAVACDDPGQLESDSEDSAAGQIAAVDGKPDAKCDGRCFVTAIQIDDTQGNSTIAALAVDGTGATWVAGRLAGPADVGGAALTPVGGEDAFVATIDDCGDVLWARSFGGAGDEEVLDLAVDELGNAYVFGPLVGTVDFGTGPVTGEGVGSDYFVIKLSPDGDTLWTRQLEATDGSAVAVSLDVDAAGNLFLLGNLEGTATFDGATVSSPVVRSFLFEIAPAPSVLWASVLPTLADWQSLQVEAAPDGGAFVAGQDARGVGVFALAVSATGEVEWVQSFRAPDQFDESLLDLTVDDDGLPVLAGRGFFAQGATPGSDPSYFVAKLGDDGEPAWITFREEPGQHVDDDPDAGLTLAGQTCNTTAPPASIGCKVRLSELSDDGDEVETRTAVGGATVTAFDVDGAGRPALAGATLEHFKAHGCGTELAAGELYVARLKH